MNGGAVFLDASAWLAALSVREQRHAECARFYDDLAAARGIILTTSLVLLRREIENYLYDPEIVSRCAAAAGVPFDQASYDGVSPDTANQDLKEAPVPATIQRLCGTPRSTR